MLRIHSKPRSAPAWLGGACGLVNRVEISVNWGSQLHDIIGTLLGRLSAAAVEFAKKGFSVVELEGGFNTWERAKLEVETASVT